MDTFNPYADPLYSFTEDGKRLLNSGSSCFIFNEGAFFTKDFIVESNGTKLVEGKDFVYILPFKEATHRCAMRVYAGIYVFNGETKSPLISGIKLGSRYTVAIETIKLQLADKSLDEILSTNYDDLITDSYVPPVKIEFSKDIWYGEQQLREQIAALKEAILNKDLDASLGYAMLGEVINTLERVITNPIIKSHLQHRGHTHSGTPEELGLRRERGNALDSTRIFGYTKEELISLIRSTLPDESSLASKITIDGGRVGTVTLDDQLSLIAGNVFVMDSYDGQLSLDVKGLMELGSDSLETIITVGDNVLRIDSAQREIYLNDDELVTENNIDQIIADVSNVEANVKTADTTSVSWTGDGSSNNPLIPSLKESFLATNGYNYLTHKAIDSYNIGIVPAAAKELRDALNEKLKKGLTLCGRKWNGDTNIVKDDIRGLERVENYSDRNLPLSDLAKLELEKYSLKGHKHEQVELDLPYADEFVAGLFTYAPYNAMDTSKLAELYLGYEEREEVLGGKLDQEAYSVVYVNEGYGDLIENVLFKDFTLVMPSLPLHVHGNTVLLPEQEVDLTVLSNHKSTYLYISIDLELMVYRVSNEVDKYNLNLGSVYTDTFGIRTHELRNVTVELESATNRTHVLNTLTPHINKFDKDFIGLGLVENLPPVTEPKSVESGYATTLTLLKVSSEHNSLFRFALELTEDLKVKWNNGTIKQHIVDTYKVRQLGDEESVSLSLDNVALQLVGGNCIKVYATLPADGYVDEGQPLPPDELYPIGSYYYTVDQINPGTYLGGVWDPVETIDLPEELRKYWYLEEGAEIAVYDEFIPKNENYDFVVLLPNPEYNGAFAKEVVGEDNVERLQIDYSGSVVDSAVYDYRYSEDGYRTHVLLKKTTGILTPLDELKYVWIRVA